MTRANLQRGSAEVTPEEEALICGKVCFGPIIKTIPVEKPRLTLLLCFAWPASALPDDFFRFDT